MSVLRLTEEQYAARIARLKNAHGAGSDTRKASVGRHALSQPAAVAPSKYRNQKTDGYASKKERDRALQLGLMFEAGEIRDLREQVRFLLIPTQEGERPCHYIADFVYERFPDWQMVVEDCKGYRTPEYVIKRKLLLHVHGIRITEI